jgi:hypothetical protein
MMWLVTECTIAPAVYIEVASGMGTTLLWCRSLAPAILTGSSATLSLGFSQGLILTGRQLTGDSKFIRSLGLCHEQNSKSGMSFIIDF